MIAEQFFVGRISGFGVVRGLTGKVLRRFTVEYRGQWQEEHRALHLDETYTYVDGETFDRNWAIHTDDEGFLLGADALQAARLRGRQRGNDFRLVFDRPRRPGGPLEPPQVVDFLEISADRAIMVGRVSLFGIPLATVHAALTRQA